MRSMTGEILDERQARELRKIRRQPFLKIGLKFLKRKPHKPKMKKLITLLLMTSAVVCFADPTTKELDAVIAKYGKQLYTVKSYTAPNAKEPLIGFTHSTRGGLQLPPPSLPQPAPTPTPKK